MTKKTVFNLRRNLVLILAIILFVFIFPKGVSADLIDPRAEEQYANSSCSSINEKEILCYYVYNKGSKCTKDIDINNPKVRFLATSGSASGNISKYCLKLETTKEVLFFHLDHFFIRFIITFLLEILVFFAFGFRNKKSFYCIFFANLISYSWFYYLSTILLCNSIFLMEVGVIIFESLFLKAFLKDIALRKIILATTVANFVSAFLGFIILLFISRNISSRLWDSLMTK